MATIASGDNSPSKNFFIAACPLCLNQSNFYKVKGTKVDPWISQLDVGFSRSEWVICKSCALVMQNPRPTQVLLEKLYSGHAYHMHQAESEEAIRKNLSLVEYCFAEKIAFIERFSKLEGKVKPRVLDIGCGMGEALIAFRNRGYQPFGVQPDSELVKKALDYCNLEVVQGFFDPSAFEKNSFDLIFSNHVIEHTKDPVEIALGIASLLKPGGMCFTCVPTYPKNRTLIPWEAMMMSHNWLFSSKSLSRVFERGGLRKVSHVYNGSSLYPDELWLLVEKPVEKEVATSKKYRESWYLVALDIKFIVPLRAIFWFPGQIFLKTRKMFRLTKGNPILIFGYFKSILERRSRHLRLILRLK